MLCQCEELRFLISQHWQSMRGRPTILLTGPMLRCYVSPLHDSHMRWSVLELQRMHWTETARVESCQLSIILFSARISVTFCSVVCLLLLEGFAIKESYKLMSIFSGQLMSQCFVFIFTCPAFSAVFSPLLFIPCYINRCYSILWFCHLILHRWCHLYI